jgi:hypothetical protein
MFLTLALGAGELLVSCPGHFTPRERAPSTHWIGGWVGLRDGEIIRIEHLSQIWTSKRTQYKYKFYCKFISFYEPHLFLRFPPTPNMTASCSSECLCTMHWKECGRKQSSTSCYCPSIHLKGMNFMKNCLRIGCASTDIQALGLTHISHCRNVSWE